MLADCWQSSSEDNFDTVDKPNQNWPGISHARQSIQALVYRNEYIGALRLLTNHKDPAAFIKVMDFAQDFVSRIDFADLDAARAVLANCNAFKDPTDAERLLLPPRPSRG